jgi:NAD(P)-dependent dehydrogenase (short-subunit alcohol dehydrogenase family)
MAEPRGPTGKNLVVTGGAKPRGYGHVLAFPEAGYDIAVLDVPSPMEGVHALATVEMTDAPVTAVEERGGCCHHAQRIAA